MRGLRTVDLRRNDRIGNINIIITQELVDPECVVRELCVAVAGQNLRCCCKSGKETGDVIRCSPHVAEALFRPTLNRRPALVQRIN